MPPRNIVRSKPRKLVSSSEDDSSSIVTVKTSSKKKTVKSSSSNETPVKTSTKKKVKSSSSSETPIKPVKVSNKMKTTPKAKKVLSTSSFSSETPVKPVKVSNRMKTTPKAKKILSSSSSENETPSDQRKRSVNSSSPNIISPRKNILPSSTDRTQVKSPTEKKSSENSTNKKQQVKSSEESDTESQLNRLFPTDITGIISDMVSEFEGKTNIFKDTEKTDKILLNGNNIIYVSDHNITAHNLNNYKTVFNVKHEYDIKNIIGIFNIRNNIVILQENKDNDLVVNLHKINDGTKIRSKVIYLDNKINYLVGTSQNIIIKIGKKLYIADPFDNNNELTIMDKEDLILELSPENNPMRKWEKGFYIFKNNTIYIFDNTKLINKITTDRKIDKVITNKDIFYWSSLYEGYMYISKYTLSLNEKENDIFKYDSELDYNIKDGKIFLYGTYYSGISEDPYHYTSKIVCIDLQTKMVKYSDTDHYTSQSKRIIFHDFIDNKIIYSEIFSKFSVYIYDFNNKITIVYQLPEDTLYLGTTSTNKIVFKNKESLTVLK